MKFSWASHNDTSSRNGNSFETKSLAWSCFENQNRERKKDRKSQKVKKKGAEKSRPKSEGRENLARQSGNGRKEIPVRGPALAPRCVSLIHSRVSTSTWCRSPSHFLCLLTSGHSSKLLAEFKITDSPSLLCFSFISVFFFQTFTYNFNFCWTRNRNKNYFNKILWWNKLFYQRNL